MNSGSGGVDERAKCNHIRLFGGVAYLAYGMVLADHLDNSLARPADFRQCISMIKE